MSDLASLVGAEFDGYAQPTPEGEWAYALDDGAEFGPGWWPFYRRPHFSALPEPAGIRLAPDTDYRSWRNEYVLVFNDHEHPRLCWLPGLRIWLRPQGMGGYVWRASKITLDIPTGTWAIDGDVPAEVLTEVETKVAKIHAFILAMRSLRRRGVKQPPNAHEVWLAKQATP